MREIFDQSGLIGRRKTFYFLFNNYFSLNFGVQGRVTITPSDFSEDGCYRVFLARFFVIFRVMGVIAGHWRAQIFESWVL